MHSSTSQRKAAVNHSHRFVINDQDILCEDGQMARGDKSGKEREEAEMKLMLSKFEPGTNLLDRRILYEVTRMRINQDEFLDEDSSD